MSLSLREFSFLNKAVCVCVAKPRDLLKNNLTHSRIPIRPLHIFEIIS